jgi:hypothetical protein
MQGEALARGSVMEVQFANCTYVIICIYYLLQRHPQFRREVGIFDVMEVQFANYTYVIFVFIITSKTPIIRREVGIFDVI